MSEIDRFIAVVVLKNINCFTNCVYFYIIKTFLQKTTYFKKTQEDMEYFQLLLT